MKKIILISLLILILIQFFRIDKENPRVDLQKDLLIFSDASFEVQSLMKNSCYDCHSFETKYPWYSNIAPISWSIKNHVNDGRKHVNFSTFLDYNSDQKDHIIRDCIEVLENKEMPTAGYTAIHKNAILSEKDNQILIDYFEKILKKNKITN